MMAAAQRGKRRERGSGRQSKEVLQAKDLEHRREQGRGKDKEEEQKENEWKG